MSAAPGASLSRGILASLIIAAIAAVILLMMGREPICNCGTVKLWHGDINSSENSQHLSDWYSPSHLLHGLFFYGLFWLILGRQSVGFRLAIATLVEVAWEIAENTNAIIERYREATIALDYFGDSVLNSMSDTAFMLLGFFIASRVPVWVSIALFVAAELIVGYFIRDGLTLNVIMLIAPQDWIKEWQSVAWSR